MKKLMVSLLAISLLALAVPVLANTRCPQPVEGCNVDFDVTATKTVDVDKYVDIDKYFDFFVFAWINPNALAECDVFKCDLNEFGYVDSYFGLFTDDLNYSFNEFTGIGQANQAAGYLNNQGNVVAAAIVSTDKAAAMTEVAVDQTNFFNTLDVFASVSIDSICSSFNDFTGIGQANQSAGHMNNQNNVVALSAGLGDSCRADEFVAANDTYLTQKNTLGLAKVCFAYNSNNINGSFNGFTGIGQVNQSAGSMNNQANVVSIAYTGPRP
jgi:hypothetical protein